MSLMTTREFARLIQEADPSGTLLVSFRVVDSEYPHELIAHGEIESVDFSIKGAKATDDGDRDVLRVRLALETQV